MIPRATSSRRSQAVPLLVVTLFCGSAQAASGPAELADETRPTSRDTGQRATRRQHTPRPIPQKSSSHMANPQIKQTETLMQAFAQRTGLTSNQVPRRYLWTDAFAVCNFLALARETGERHFLALAQRLVDQTHHLLGRHRKDDPRSGWISGLGDDVGQAHPTRGGLRIGKPLPERRPGDPFDERLEWDRDGQYFHYLTKWVHALDQLGRATHDPRFTQWARELTVASQRAFVYRPSPASALRMYWKMSIDLSRPLVTAMGQHDPLDGYVTVMQVLAGPAAIPDDTSAGDLELAAQDFAKLLAGSELTSTDPLGLGGLMVDGYRVAQLMRNGSLAGEDLLQRLLLAALKGLQLYMRSDELQAPAGYRLAFRELGLAIGLLAVQRLSQQVSAGNIAISPAVRQPLTKLTRFTPFAEQIASFWSQDRAQRSASWLEHRDINEVMLATALLPDGFLELHLSD